jgi:hypothetical protein
MQIRVDEQEALYLEFLTKRLCKVPISIPHDDDFDALISPRLHRVTQLRDLLTTEQSTEVAQEDENNRLVLPQIAQTNWLVRCRIDQGDRREAGRTTHGHLLSNESGFRAVLRAPRRKF